MVLTATADRKVLLEDGILMLAVSLLPGVIPIDRLTDVRAPTAVIAQRIQRQRLEEAYNVHLPKPSGHDAAGRWATLHLNSAVKGRCRSSYSRVRAVVEAQSTLKFLSK